MFEWYNENQFRSWPLKSGATLGNTVLVDAGFTCGLPATVNITVLTLIARDTDKFRLFVRVGGYQVVFEIPVDTPEFTTIWAAPPAVSNATFLNNCMSGKTLYGFIVIGKIQELLTLLPDADTSLVFADEFEPTVTDIINSKAVSSISLGNTARTVSPGLINCTNNPYIRPTPYKIKNADGISYSGVSIDYNCISGDIVWKPGYSCRIIQSDSVKSFTISATQDSQEGVACGDVPIDDAEAALLVSGGNLSGVQTCADVIRSINGISGPNITIKGGPGVKITNEIPATIVVELGANDANNCGLPQ